MPETPKDTNGQPIPIRTPWAVHATCYVLLALLLAWILVQRYFRPLVLEKGITVAASCPAGTDVATANKPASPLDQRIDPNTATWSELTHLPRIGEQIAKRIVEYRQTHRPAADAASAANLAAARPVFTCPQDLARVRGIGPKTVELIAPHLKFPASPTSFPH